MKQNPQIAIAIRTIGQGFIALADALATPEVEEPEAQVEEKPKRTRSPAKKDEPKPQAEEPAADAEDEAQEPDQADEAPKDPPKLEDLQEAASALLAAKKRDKLIEVLEKHGIPKASAAPKNIWVELLADLQAALDD